MAPTRPYCARCRKFFDTEQGLNTHLSVKPQCLARHMRDFQQSQAGPSNHNSAENINESGRGRRGPRNVPTTSTEPTGDWSQPSWLEACGDDGDPVCSDEENSRPDPKRRRTSEKASDWDALGERAPLYTRDFPAEKEAGKSYGRGETRFEEQRRKTKDKPWEPFRGEGEAKLGQWVLKNLGHNQTEKFLSMEKVSTLHRVMLCSTCSLSLGLMPRPPCSSATR